MRRACSVLTLALALAGCGSKSPETTAEATKGDAAPPTPLASATAKLTGAIELPRAIPAEAFAVVVVRMPEPWLGTLTKYDPFPGAGDDIASLQAELDEITRTRLGVTLTAVHAAAAFAIDQDSFAAVIDGVVGEPKGKPVAPGIVALEGPPAVHAAVIDARLIIGSVAAAMAAAGDPGKQLAGDAPEWFGKNTDAAA